MIRRTICTLAICFVTPLTAQAPTDPAWQAVGAALQSTVVDGGGYARVNFPRADLNVMVGDVRITPGFALTSWIGFSGTPAAAHAMGDLVLTTAELPRVIAALAAQHMDLMAIHHHLAGESPSIVYAHYHAMGTALDIAKRLDAVLRVTATPRPVVPATATALTIDSGLVFRTLGKSGKASGALVTTSFVLVPGTVTMMGQTLIGAMAYSTPINFLQVSPTRAVTNGDFAVTADKVARLTETLAAKGIASISMHSHLVGESPSIYFVHFWGDGDLATLATGLRAVLDAVR